MIGRVTVLCFVVALVGTVPVLAQDDEAADNKYYLGGVYHAFTLTESGGDLMFSTLGVRGGYEFTDAFSLEAEGLFGVSEEDFGGFFGVDVAIGVKYALAGFAKYTFHEGDKLGMFARGGVGYAEFEASASDGVSSVSISEGEGYYALGVGGEYMFTDALSLRGDIGVAAFFEEADNVNDYTTFGVSLMYNF